MIIVEGVDGSGKTTLLNKIVVNGICNEWGGEPKIIHSPGPLETGLFEWAIKALKEAPDWAIFDRFPYFSERVYGGILRHRFLLNSNQFKTLRLELKVRDPFVIYCRPPTYILTASSRVENQMEGVLENLLLITKAYDQSLARWMEEFRVFQYDFTTPEIDNRLFIAIREYIREDYKRGGWG